MRTKNKVLKILGILFSAFGAITLIVAVVLMVMGIRFKSNSDLVMVTITEISSVKITEAATAEG